MDFMKKRTSIHSITASFPQPIKKKQDNYMIFIINQLELSL